MFVIEAGEPLFRAHSNGTTPTIVSPAESEGVLYGVDAWNESDKATFGNPALSRAAGATGVSNVAGTLAVPGSTLVGVLSTRNPAVIGGLAVASGMPLPLVRLNTPPTEPENPVLMVTEMFVVLVVPWKMASAAELKVPVPVQPTVKPALSVSWIA